MDKKTFSKSDVIGLGHRIYNGDCIDILSLYLELPEKSVYSYLLALSTYTPSIPLSVTSITDKIIYIIFNLLKNRLSQ